MNLGKALNPFRRAKCAPPAITSFGIGNKVASYLERAQRLFNRADIPLFVILLQSDLGRRAHVYGHIVREFPACNVFPATEPREVAGFLDQEKITLSTLIVPPRIACTASHFRVWKEIIAQGIGCAIVFEDDVAIRKGFRRFVQELKAQLPPDFDVVHLYISAVRKEWKDHAARAAGAYVSYVPHFGRSAYLVSRSGAQKLIAAFQTIRAHGDVQISQLAQEGNLTVYSASREYVRNLGQLRSQFKGEKFRSTLHEHEQQIG